MISKKVGITFLALTLSLVACGQDEAVPQSSETQVNPLVINERSNELGVPSELGARPYQVALLNKVGRKRCGGTIINKKWILTSNVCVKEQSESDILVRAGSLEYKKGGQLKLVKRIIMHPDHGKGHLRNNNVAVIELESDLEFNDSVSAAALPTKAIEQTHAAPGSFQIISGWGNRGRILPDFLAEAPLKVMSNQACHKEFTSGITDQMICGTTDDKAQLKLGCIGESGGPFASKVNSKHFIFGVVNGRNGCVSSTIFTRVSALQGWITQTTGVQPGQVEETQPKNVKSFVERKPIDDRTLYYYPAKDQGFKHAGGNIGILFNVFNKGAYVAFLERLTDSGQWEIQESLVDVQPLGKINDDFPAGTYRLRIGIDKKEKGNFYQVMGSYNGE